MSLLHRALKKAEKGVADPSVHSAVMIDREDSSRSSVRTALLVAMVVTSLLSVVYFRFLRKAPDAHFQPKDIPSVVSQSEVSKVSAASFLEEGRQKIETSQFETAREAFQHAVLLDPLNAEAYNNLGLALKKLGQNEEASEQYRKALSIDPQCAECRNNLGVLSMAQKDLPAAETEFKKAIELKPDYADPYFHLALLQEGRGESTQAKKNYEKFMELKKGVAADFLVKIQKRIATLPSQ